MDMVAKFSKEEQTIPLATVLGEAEEIRDELENQINADDKPKSDLVNDQKEKRAWVPEILLGDFDHLSEV